jgi:hypothetical protein
MKAFLAKEGVIENVAVFNGSLPNGWQAVTQGESIGWVEDGSGGYMAPPSNNGTTAQATRDRLLTQLVHDLGNGRIIQTRPQDEQNIRNAIEIMTANNIPSIEWVMVDDVKHVVTVPELQTALTSGQMAAMAIWNSYIP